MDDVLDALGDLLGAILGAVVDALTPASEPSRVKPPRVGLQKRPERSTMDT